MTAVAVEAARSVRCGCSAAGRMTEGRSSCVVTEFEGVCHTAFDLFDVVKEFEAARFIKQYWRKKFRYRHIEKDEPINWQIEDRNLAMQLSVYLAMSLRKFENISDIEDNIEKMLNRLYRGASSISSRFVSPAIPPLQLPDLYVTYGCVEYLGPGLKAMYKASWSPAAGKDRCR